MVFFLRTCLRWSRVFSFKNALPSRPQLLFTSGSRLSVHTASAARGKIFTDRENIHSYEIIQKLEGYQLSPEYELQTLCEDLSKEHVLHLCSHPPSSPHLIVQGLSSIVRYCSENQVPIADETFDSFIDNFGECCNQLSDEQIQICLNLLRFIPEPPGINSRNFYELWKPLDDVCLSRLEGWDVNQVLQLSDGWYRLNLVKASEFVWEGVKKVGKKIRKLSPAQLVQFSFICNLVRKPLVEMIDVEMQFKHQFEQLSLDEVGVICAGFFKTQTKLYSPELISKIYARIMDSVDVVDDITLVNYIKILRYSSKLGEAEMLHQLLEKMCSQIDRISTLACLHVALMGCDLQMCHQKCVELVLNRFNRDEEVMRLKDMERTAHVMGLFNIETESGVHHELSRKMLRNVQSRIEEILLYPKCFQACLHYLTLCGHHDEDMLNAALDKKFLQHVFGRNKLLGREVFCLDSFARINLKDTYTGNLLNDKQLKTMGKLFTHYIPDKDSRFKLSVTDRILVDVNETCKRLWEVSTVMHVLPHFERPDIVILHDAPRRKGVPLDQSCPEHYSGQIIRVSDIAGSQETRKLDAVAIIIGGWNNFVRNTNRPTGMLSMKLKQLRILGYSPILVPWYEWREQETSADKRQYLQRKMTAALEHT